MGNWPGDQSPGYGDPGQQGGWDAGGTPGSARERIQPPPAFDQPPPTAYQQPGYPGQQPGYADPQYGYVQSSAALVQQNAWAAPYPAAQPATFAVARSQSNGMAVASLVLGITSIVFCWWGLLAVLQVVLAIVFGCIALGQSNRGAGGQSSLAIGGIICACIGLMCYFVIGIFTLGIFLLI
jgi:hypothetical protein